MPPLLSAETRSDVPWFDQIGHTPLIRLSRIERAVPGIEL
jgi:hypothetical protein